MSLFVQKPIEDGSGGTTRSPGPGGVESGDFGVSANKLLAIKNKFVLITCDPGTDDCYALIILIKAHKSPYSNIYIVGVIADYGNTTLENATNNLHRILDVMGAPDIPIFSGSKRSLVKSYHEEPDFFGPDGLHSTVFEDNLALITQKVRGFEAISQLATQYPNQITLLCIGPLTTVATAIRVDDSICGKLKELLYSGCTIRGEGSQSAVADFNSLNDPEAVDIVFTSLTCPIFVLPREIRKDFGKMTREFRVELGDESPQMKMMNKVEREYLAGTNDEWFADDAIIASMIVNQEVITRIEPFYVKVSTCGCDCRAMTLVYRNPAKAPLPPNVQMITRFNGDLFKAILKDACST